MNPIIDDIDMLPTKITSGYLTYYFNGGVINGIHMLSKIEYCFIAILVLWNIFFDKNIKYLSILITYTLLKLNYICYVESLLHNYHMMVCRNIKIEKNIV